MSRPLNETPSSWCGSMIARGRSPRSCSKSRSITTSEASSTAGSTARASCREAAALHQYRDREWAARVDLAHLQANEGAWHWIWRKLRPRPPPRMTVADEVRALTPREREVLSLAADGLTDGAIAERLYLTRRTVETHL